MLDEPTVGMDPLLRKRIWDYLIDLSHTQKTTIIITTHYIEEARQADFLGFMRKGKIIEENRPETLMTKYNHNILEDVFYSICCNTKLANNQNDVHKKNSIQFIDESYVKDDKQKISNGHIINEEFKSELINFVDSNNNLSDEILIKNVFIKYNDINLYLNMNIFLIIRKEIQIFVENCQKQSKMSFLCHFNEL
jgi:ABC-type multidrug transport system ATPase subunit